MVNTVTHRYIGSGPYCYANSVAMVLDDGTDPGLVEVLTGSPFGMQLLGGRRPLFDPLGWDPGIGMDAALHLLGWTCERSDGGTEAEALARLRAASATGPVLVGPLEMGLLSHHPGAGTPIGADHFVVVTGYDDDVVRCHDPHGHPFATLPAQDFAAAWRADSIGYADTRYTMRRAFRRIRVVTPHDALLASLPLAVTWLAGRPELAPPGSLACADAANALADFADAGLSDDQRGDLAWFAVRVGARRLADAAFWLRRIGKTTAADIALHQARLVGALQHPVVHGDDTAVAATLRELAPTYARLRAELAD